MFAGRFASRTEEDINILLKNKDSKIDKKQVQSQLYYRLAGKVLYDEGTCECARTSASSRFMQTSERKMDHLSTNTGIFPDELKHIKVTPIHKSGEKTDCGYI